MTITSLFRAGASALALCAFLGTATASPGAHSPDGEHLDGAGHSHSAVSDAPRMEAHSELFELVATLADGELSILIDRFATNEPVLGATVEVEAGTLKARARFHVDHGDYAVADAAFLKAVATPGEHALVFTVTAGAEADLLDGVLKVDAGHVGATPPGRPDSAPRPAKPWLWALAVPSVLFAVGVVWHTRRRWMHLKRAA